MAKELFFRPIHFVSHLRQEGAAAVALAHVDALTAIVELADVVDALQGCEHGDFNLDVL